MEITRHNYEEYFLLYVDKELNALERKAVEVFVQENPDLEEELIMLQQSVLRADEKQVFIPKEYLLKDTAKQGLVNEGNYEEFFVLYGDDELTNEQKDLVEQFVYKFPQYQAEFELIQQARLVPETIHFRDKQDLYRSEKDDNRVVPFGWWRMVAAAIVLITIGGLSLYLGNKDVSIVEPIVKVDTPVIETPTPTVKTELATDEKKSDNSSNIITTPRVQHTESTSPLFVKQQKIENNIIHHAVKPVEVEVENSKPVDNSTLGNTTISAPAAVATLALATPEVTTTTVAAVVVEEPMETQTSNHYVLNAPVNKTPLRGLFRKISRVVDKATTVERDENGRGGVRIANFEIGLK